MGDSPPQDYAGDPPVRVVATAVSAKRTIAVDVGDNGQVIGLRILSDVVRQWDTYTLSQRIIAVADVAHDRYLANQPNHDGYYPDHAEVSAAERKLKF
ncbi:hypothetical protein [Mycobacteroides abscessus]|nr:hypothetical protein [Mycobacteroides abscessus]SLJ75711.1 Uncharacterised protein [Mycobacteroides abscessus subsp. abscessus]SLJ77491.1 Uncharacterised protein [Mycobacteroides abscessus subsp. abscessus]